MNLNYNKCDTIGCGKKVLRSVLVILSFLVCLLDIHKKFPKKIQRFNYLILTIYHVIIFRFIPIERIFLNYIILRISFQPLLYIYKKNFPHFSFVESEYGISFPPISFSKLVSSVFVYECVCVLMII